MRGRQFWLVAFTGHFLFIAGVSCSDVINLVGDRQTFLPRSLAQPASKMADAMKAISPRRLPRLNPVRHFVLGYAHAAGIESPYTFFAPNVPDSLKVVFELEFPNKRTSYELPRVQSDTEGLRLAALIDQSAASSGPWREVVFQMLAAGSAENNPDATRIRVVVARLKFPDPAAYLKEAKPSYEFVSSYDFIPAASREPNQGE